MIAFVLMTLTLFLNTFIYLMTLTLDPSVHICGFAAPPSQGRLFPSLDSRFRLVTCFVQGTGEHRLAHLSQPSPWGAVCSLLLSRSWLSP